MKILHVISSVTPKGGGPIEGIKQLFPSLTSLGATVEIACCDAPDAPWLIDKRLPPVHALGPKKSSYAYSQKLTPWLRENSKKYDAVIVEGIWQYHSFAVRKALADSKTPYFLFTHGMLDPWFKEQYPLKHIKKWIYWTLAENRVLRDAKAVIFTCEDERLLARKSFGLYKANEAVASYGTSSPPEEGRLLAENFLSTYPELQGKRIILFLSRIHEKKGCDLLIEAFAQVANQDNNLHLVVAGPDQTGWTKELKARAEELGIIKKISWPGMLEGDLKWGAFYASEAFCLPSHQENFGIVVAEALACGKPVLISNKINIWREISHDHAGFINEDTVAGTVKNLKNLLEMTPAEYMTMCNEAKACFNRRFHIKQAALRLLEIIREHI